METKKVYIQTIGCQMNVYDSGQMIDSIRPLNYRTTDSISKADLIIVNTCAIRGKAVQKVYSFIGRLSAYKKRKKTLLIVVAGCVAQQQGQNLVDRFPQVDIVLGTHSVYRLPDMILELEKNKNALIDIEMRNDYPEFNPDKTIFLKQTDVARFVTIMRGCDNYCTYCVVPYVRGRETTRLPKDIINEIMLYVRSGIKEVTLLGQNVNSYGIKEGLHSFTDLLEMVNSLEGLERIRFVTSHPKDLSDSLIDSFNKLEKLCNHIHLPVQSGSNQILKRMNRKYTNEQYIEKIEKLRSVSSDIAISTDIIVGFPGESQKDFDMTLNLIETVEFDSLFVFEYSDRPNAPAAHFSEKIPPDLKNQRLQEILKVQENISRGKSARLIGNIYPVLIEGISKKQLKHDIESNTSDIELTGRTSENRIVNFSVFPDSALDINSMKGQIIDVRIDKACSNSLWGAPVDNRAVKNKRDRFYVA